MNGEIAKWVAIVLTLISMLVGATWYMSSAQADIKSWTVDQDSATKEQVLQHLRDRYVPKEEFIELKTDLRHIKNTLDKIERKIE